MKTNTIKYLVDWGLFLGFCLIGVTGAIVGWIVPPGGGHGEDRVFLGLHRHGWIDIHLFFAVVVTVLVAGHLFLSWSWIVNATKRRLGKRWLEGLLVIACGWLPIFFLAWLVALIGSCF
jgi:hypothetical protein